MERIALGLLRQESDIQPRAQLNLFIIDEYAQAMRDGASFPPVIVFHDGAVYWLADGFHRVNAARQLGLVDIEADIKEGSRRDAVLYSVSANTMHGIRRTNEDKRRAVMTLLQDNEWGRWSDSEIARQCSVSHTLVQNLRPSCNIARCDERTVKRGDTVYQQNTANIGATLTPEERIWAQDNLSTDVAVGVSRPTLAKAKAIVEAAEQEPERFGDLVAQMDETGKIDRAYRDLRERQRRESATLRLQRIVSGRLASPDGTESRLTVLCGDMLEIVPGLGVFNTIIADPPYGVTEWPWDDWNSIGKYLAQCERWLEVLREARAEQYHLFWFCSPKMAADVEMIFRKLDLPINSRLVWHRRNMALGSIAKDRFLDSWEMIFHSGNTSLNWPSSWDDGRFDVQAFDVQTFAVPQTNYTDCKLHPTQKPLNLMKWLLIYGSWPGARVLDPFAGAGTTGVACPEDRTCILVEQEQEYVDVIRQRLGL